MSNCIITLRSTIDGNSTTSKFTGTFSKEEKHVELRYADNGAHVRITLTPALVEITRRGDYTLYLPLQAGKKTKGTIGINGGEGVVSIACERVEYTLKEDGVLLLASYELIFGEEAQKTSLCLRAQREKNEN